MGSHTKGFDSPLLVAMSPQGPLQSSSSSAHLRQQERVTDAETEGTPSLCDSGAEAQRHEAMVSCNWGKREGNATKVLSHKGNESSGLDIDAFLPPSLSPRQARHTALPRPSILQKVQQPGDVYRVLLPARSCNQGNCITVRMTYLCVCVCVCVCVNFICVLVCACV